MFSFNEDIFHNTEVILTDMDGTLIDTDYANNLAYQKAIRYYVSDFVIPLKGRLTQTIVGNYFLNRKLINKIKLKKDEYFSDFLDKTHINNMLYDLLLASKYNKKIYLVTKACQKRGNMLIEHHRLSSLFDNIFFCKNKNNKYLSAIYYAQISPERVIVFEDDLMEIEDAYKANIPRENIINVQL